MGKENEAVVHPSYDDALPAPPTSVPAPSAADLVGPRLEQRDVISQPGTVVPLRSQVIDLKYPEIPTVQLNTTASFGDGGPSLDVLLSLAESLDPDNKEKLELTIRAASENGFTQFEIDDIMLKYNNFAGIVDREETGGNVDVGYSFHAGAGRLGDMTQTDKFVEGNSISQQAFVTLSNELRLASPVVTSEEITGRPTEVITVDQPWQGFAGAGLTATANLSPQTGVAAVAEIEGQFPANALVARGGVRLEHDTELGGPLTLGVQAIGNVATENFGGLKRNWTADVSGDATYRFSPFTALSAQLGWNSDQNVGLIPDANAGTPGGGFYGGLRLDQNIGRNFSVSAFINQQFGGGTYYGLGPRLRF